MTKMVTMHVPAELAGKVRKVVKNLVRDAVPAKPIKRELRIKDAEMKKTMVLLQEAGKRLKRISKEYERLEMLFDSDHRLSASDSVWVDKNLARLNKVLSYAADEVMYF